MTKRNYGTRSITIALGCILILAPLLAFGVSLDEAKQQGWIGERPDGYLGLVTPSPTADTVQLMKDINRKRRTLYQDIAGKNGTALSAVEALAGKKAIEQTPSGRFIMQPNGTWIPKP